MGMMIMTFFTTLPLLFNLGHGLGFSSHKENFFFLISANQRLIANCFFLEHSGSKTWLKNLFLKLKSNGRFKILTKYCRMQT